MIELVALMENGQKTIQEKEDSNFYAYIFPVIPKSKPVSTPGGNL